MIRRSSPAGLLAASLLIGAPLGAQAPALATPAAAARAAATITSEDVRRRVGVLAHDSMRGRATPSPELDGAAQWIAAEFGRLGLRPGGDEDGFIQRYPIRTVALDPLASRGRFGDTDVRIGRDWAPAYAAAPPTGRLTGTLVVLSGSTNAAEALASTDLTGRHVLIAPFFEGDVETPEVRALMQAVRAKGALAIWVAIDHTDGVWAARANNELRREHRQIGEGESLAIFRVRDASVGSALVGAGLDLATLRRRFKQPVTVHDAAAVLVTLEPVMRTVSEEFAPNVVGILEGSDPTLSTEYVVYSAHMDHVGVGSPDATGDSIYNGADDDASGTATVVELAEAFAALEPRPRRSMIFLAVSGEEQGLWGSRHFVANAPVTPAQMVANVNIDMVGRNWTDTIVAIGKEHSDLGETLARVNAAHPELGMTAIDDLWPEESFYTRSDHYNFAVAGVPVLFFFNGTHEDYHEPSDEVESIDADKTARIGRLLFYLGLDVANRTERPVWDPESYRTIVGVPGGA
jgi:hypothetical protein